MIPCKFQPPRVPFGVHRVMPVKGSLAEVNSADPFFYIKHHMNGEKEVVFHVNLIDILDKVFLLDGMKFLSIDQERFIIKFIEETEKINDAYLNSKENINLDANTTNLLNYTDLGIITESYSNANLDDVDKVFLELDRFLGNYVGVDENEYTR